MQILTNSNKKNSIRKKILITFYGNTMAILLITFVFFFYYSYHHEFTEYEQMRKSYNKPTVDQQLETDQRGTSISGYAPIRDRNGMAVGIDIGIVTIHRDFLIGLAVIIVFSFGITTFSIRKRIKDFLEPINQITEGIKQVGRGNLDYRVNLKTNDEFEVMANMVNQAAVVMISNKRILEKDLQITKEQRQNIFKVYSDVIYSVTQGKFNLVSYQDSILIADDGVLQAEAKLEKAEDVGEVRNLVERNLTTLRFSDETIQNILFCVSEAATNVIKHAKDGYVQVRVLEELVRIVVSDHGSGMDFNKLPNMIFLKGFSTKISLGVGFSIMYKFADKIYLSTSKDGTCIAMDFFKEPNVKRGLK